MSYRHFKLLFILAVAVCGFGLIGSDVEAGHRYYSAPPSYYVVPPVVAYEPVMVAPAPVVTYYAPPPVVHYYAPPPPPAYVYSYGWYPAYGEIEVEYKWRNGMLTVEFDD